MLTPHGLARRQHEPREIHDESMMTDAKDDETPATRRAWISLGILVIVYVFNFIDRQVLATLAPAIKTDLRISDADLGFLYGTAFAVFYAVFGIPLGLLADIASRRVVIAVGFAFWSAMTALSGFAQTFSHLALARVGVGVGESSASPAAYSLISDLFPKRQRAFALGLYAGGLYLGIGLGAFIGGSIVDRWDLAWHGVAAPWGLRGWQVAFFVLGIPGLLFAPLVFAIREPGRGSREGVVAPQHASPIRAAVRELLRLLPPTSWWFMRGSPGLATTNIRAAVLIAAAGVVLAVATGGWTQWMSVAVGALVIVTYAQQLRLSDPPAHELIFRTPSLRYATLGFSAVAFNGYAMSGWMPAFFDRYHGLSASTIGATYGSISAVAGFLGVTLGGYVADRLRLRTPRGRLLVGIANASLTVPFFIAALNVKSPFASFGFFALWQVGAALWLGPGTSTVQDLVLPRMRARASAVFLLFVSLIGLALGPYTIGRLSDRFHDLRSAMYFGLLAYGGAIVCFVKAGKTIEEDERTRDARALAAEARRAAS